MTEVLTGLVLLETLVGGLALWYMRRKTQALRDQLLAEKRASDTALAAAKLLTEQQAAALKVLRARHQEARAADEAAAERTSGADLLNSLGPSGLHKGR